MGNGRCLFWLLVATLRHEMSDMPPTSVVVGVLLSLLMGLVSWKRGYFTSAGRAPAPEPAAHVSDWWSEEYRRVLSAGLVVRERVGRLGSILNQLRLRPRSPYIVIGSPEVAREALCSPGYEHVFPGVATVGELPAWWSDCNSWCHAPSLALKQLLPPAAWFPVRQAVHKLLLREAGLLAPNSLRQGVMDRAQENLFLGSMDRGCLLPRYTITLRNTCRYLVCALMMVECFGVVMDHATVLAVEALLQEMSTCLLPTKTRKLSWGNKAAAGAPARLLHEFTCLVGPSMEQVSARPHPPPAASFLQLISQQEQQLFPEVAHTSQVHPRSETGSKRLAALCLDFLQAGFETTACALEWAAGHLINQQVLQDRIFTEIGHTVASRLVEEQDLPMLPYLEAFTQETLRLRPPIHVQTAPLATSSCKLGGFDIQRGSMAKIHLKAIGVSPWVWADPQAFIPERFLTPGTHDASKDVMAFGAGQLLCPGNKLAKLNLKFILARLIQGFLLLPTVDDEFLPLIEGRHQALLVPLRDTFKACLVSRPAA